jgi:hypothetical protein
MALKKYLNKIIKEHDFGYDVEFIDAGEWIITEEEEIILAHTVVSLEFIENSSSLPQMGHFFIKLKKCDLTILNIKVNIEDNKDEL